MPEPVLVAVAHGSQDPRASATVRELMAMVAERAAGRGLGAPDLRTAYLGHAPPSVPQVMSTIEAGRQVRVLPLLLTAAYHAKADIPRLLTRVASDFPRLQVSYGNTLGPHPRLLRALERRLAEQDPDCDRARPERVAVRDLEPGEVAGGGGLERSGGQRHHRAPRGAVAASRRVARGPAGLRVGRRSLAGDGGDRSAAGRGAPRRSRHLPARPGPVRRPDQDILAGRGRDRRLPRPRRLRRGGRRAAGPICRD
jgi:sirohydrochlorin ferrochelatase